MTVDLTPIHVAIIGSGIAGAACAAGLRSAGIQVTVFEKTADVGGRMASRRARWTDGDGAEHAVDFDHGACGFTRIRPRFKNLMTRAMAAGCVNEWQPKVHTDWPLNRGRQLVATPTMSALAVHLLSDTPVHCNRTVQRLQRAADGAWYVAINGAPLAGPFHYVAMAIPPAQAALLLAGHHDVWADALVAKRAEPCWTLMAVTDDIDWPWDASVPKRGPLDWILRNDRVPGRAVPPGMAVWTAHATPEWSAAHLEDKPQAVSVALQAALRAQLPAAHADNRAVKWHYTDVHRWRYARSASVSNDSFGSDECRWNESLGLGVCGDFFAAGGVEAAWQSGDELADHMAASSERATTFVSADGTVNPPSETAPSIRTPAIALSP